MLTVDDYEIIRRKVLREGLSQRAVARELGVSRNSVAKALKYVIPPGYRLNEPRSRPAIEPFIKILDEWIDQNQRTVRKQRMTCKRMYERLCDDYN